MELLVILVLAGAAVYAVSKSAEAEEPPPPPPPPSTASTDSFGNVVGEIIGDIAGAVIGGVVSAQEQMMATLSQEWAGTHALFSQISFMITAEEENILEHRQKLIVREWWNRTYRQESLDIAKTELLKKYNLPDAQQDFVRRVAEYERYGVVDFGLDGILWLAANDVPQGELPEWATMPVLSLLRPLQYSTIYTEARPSPAELFEAFSWLGEMQAALIEQAPMLD